MSSAILLSYFTLFIASLLSILRLGGERFSEIMMRITTYLDR